MAPLTAGVVEARRPLWGARRAEAPPVLAERRGVDTADAAARRPDLAPVVVGASPLWVGYGISQLGSLYAIPTRSMEATLRVGDVVFAEKSSRWLARRPLDRSAASRPRAACAAASHACRF